MKIYIINLIVILFIGFSATVNPLWGDTINEDIKLSATDGTSGDEFGKSISIENDLIAIGAPYDDEYGEDSGSAYLFDKNTGLELFNLLPSDGEAGDEFGFSIAISNGIVAVGAPKDDDNGDNSGSVYLFDASTGTQLAKLTANDAETGDEFGNSITIYNGIVAVGAWRADEYGDDSGAAYLFNASTGNQLNILLPDTGYNYQTFGVSIAMDGGIVAIGARTYFVPGQGYTYAKAYLFDVPTGNQLNVLQADIENYNGDLGGHFADAIDINNGLVAVGAPNRSVFYDFSGAAYVFDASTGQQLHFIFPADGHDRDNFGISISIDNGGVAIGAHQDDDNGFNSGSAYLYNALTGAEIHKLLASDGEELDLFGASIAFDNGIIAVGAPADNDNGENSGSAYAFEVIPIEGILGDVNDDGAINVLDVIIIVNIAISTVEPTDYQLIVCDMNSDGSINVLDVIMTVNIILTGGKFKDDPVSSALIEIFGNQAKFNADGNVAGIQLQLSGNGELIPNLPVGWKFARSENTAIFYSMDGSSLESNTLFEFTDDLQIQSGIAGDWNGKGVEINLTSFPKEFGLFKPFPNPFNPATTISYAIAENSHVSLTVFNLTGKEIAKLFDSVQNEGYYSMSWNPEGLASGTYFVELGVFSTDKSRLIYSDISKVVFMK